MICWLYYLFVWFCIGIVRRSKVLILLFTCSLLKHWRSVMLLSWSSQTTLGVWCFSFFKTEAWSIGCFLSLYKFAYSETRRIWGETHLAVASGTVNAPLQRANKQLRDGDEAQRRVLLVSVWFLFRSCRNSFRQNGHKIRGGNLDYTQNRYSCNYQITVSLSYCS